MTVALTHWLGAWALAFVVLHPLLGWLAHYGFCRKHGFNPWKVDDPVRYIEQQKEVLAAMRRRDH